MYWRWNRIPELAELPPEERKRLWAEAKRDPFRLTDFLWRALIIGVAIGTGFLLIHVPKGLSIWIGLPIFLKPTSLAPEEAGVDENPESSDNSELPGGFGPDDPCDPNRGRTPAGR